MGISTVLNSGTFTGTLNSGVTFNYKTNPDTSTDYFNGTFSGTFSGGGDLQAFANSPANGEFSAVPNSFTTSNVLGHTIVTSANGMHNYSCEMNTNQILDISGVTNSTLTGYSTLTLTYTFKSKLTVTTCNSATTSGSTDSTNFSLTTLTGSGTLQ